MKHLILLFIVLFVALNQLFAADLSQTFGESFSESSYDGRIHASGLLASNEVKPIVVTEDANSSSAGNDVYNFYFQKAPGPVTVIQGGANAPAPSEQPVQKELPATTPPSKDGEAQSVAKNDISYDFKDIKRWEIAIGQGHIGILDAGSRQTPEYLGTNTGVALQGRYNFNRYFSSDALLIVAGNKGWGSQSNTMSEEQMERAKENVNWGLSAGIGFTPIRLDILGHDMLEFGIIGGLSTYHYTSEGMGIGIYLGPRLAINFSEHVAMVFESKHLQGRPTPQENNPMLAGYWGLRWKF